LAFLPNRVQSSFENGCFQFLSFGCGDFFNGIISLVKIIKFLRSFRKHRPPFQHLNLHAHFEHITCRSHGDIRNFGLCEQILRIFGSARFDTCLIHRTSGNIGGTHHKRSQRRVGNRNSSGGTDAYRMRKVIFCLKRITQTDDCRQNTHQRPVIRMPPRICLNRYIIGHRNRFCKTNLFLGQFPFRKQAGKNFFRSRLQELRGNFLS